MSSCRATASAVVRLSPVSMTMRNPSARSFFSAAAVVALIGSAMPIMPATCPSTARKIAVAPSWRNVSAAAENEVASTPWSARNAALPSATLRPSTVPVTPLPGAESKSATSAKRDAALGSGGDDGCCKRMLARTLEACGKPQHLGLGSARGRHNGDVLSACLRSACRSCRSRAYRLSPTAPTRRRF